MIFFGHLGIGNAIATPFRQRLSRRWILLGTILPDLTDKPLYYGLSLYTGKQSAELGLVSGTRTFGHTGIALLALGLFAMARRSRAAAALMLGMATHLLLDGLTERYFGHDPLQTSAIFWPFSGSFPVMPFKGIHEHFAASSEPFLLWAEAIGILLLAWDFWKLKHRTEILARFRRGRFSRSGRASSAWRKSREDQ